MWSIPRASHIRQQLREHDEGGGGQEGREESETHQQGQHALGTILERVRLALSTPRPSGKTAVHREQVEL
jgi:hypothetical protein